MATAPTDRSAIVSGQVEQCVDLGNRHPARSGGHPDYSVAGSDQALLQNAQVEPGSPVAHQQRRYPGLAEPQANPVAGDPRLAHLEQCLADLIAVPHADLVIGEPVHREVLAELAVLQVVPTQLCPPVLIRLVLVHQHGPIRPAMATQIALAVTVDIQGADQLWPLDRIFPDPGVHHPAAPGHILGQSDIDRQQPAHRRPGLSFGSLLWAHPTVFRSSIGSVSGRSRTC